MMKFNTALILMTFLLPSLWSEQVEQKPLKVFILVGQSNMQGHGTVTANPKSRNGGMGTLEYLVRSPATANQYAHLLDENGQWTERDDVWIWYLDRKGKLSVGYGANEYLIGPELQFGNVIGDYFDHQVLLIKCSWGGRSLGKNFRPPTSGGEVGEYYTETVKLVKETLQNVSTLFPEYGGRGYEVCGFGWHQGWNDRVNQQFTEEYEQNMVNFIRDIRKDLGVPRMPFVVAETGMGGLAEKHGRAVDLMNAQRDATLKEDFKGNAAFVSTRPFWRPGELSPSSQGYHWNRNAETYSLIGEGMAHAMIGLLNHASAAALDAKIKSAAKAEAVAFCRQEIKRQADYGYLALCLERLASLAGGESVTDIIPFLSHKNRWLRNEAIRIGASVAGAGVSDRWVKELTSAPSSLKLSILQLLKLRADAGTAAAIRSLIDNEDAELRLHAVRALTGFQSSEAMDALGMAAGDQDKHVMASAALALATAEGSAATDTLLTLAEKSADGTEPINACFQRLATGKVPAGERVKVLRRLLKVSRSADQRRRALGELKTIKTLDSLKVTMGYIEAPEIADDASMAAVEIAEGIPLNNEKTKKSAVDFIETVMKVSKKKETKDAAEKFIYKHRRPALQDVSEDDPADEFELD